MPAIFVNKTLEDFTKRLAKEKKSQGQYLLKQIDDNPQIFKEVIFKKINDECNISRRVAHLTELRDYLKKIGANNSGAIFFLDKSELVSWESINEKIGFDKLLESLTEHTRKSNLKEPFITKSLLWNLFEHNKVGRNDGAFNSLFSNANGSKNKDFADVNILPFFDTDTLINICLAPFPGKINSSAWLDKILSGQFPLLSKHRNTEFFKLQKAAYRLLSKRIDIDIRFGMHHTLILLKNGYVLSLGSNEFCQLGRPTLRKHDPNPGYMRINTGVKRIECGTDLSWIFLGNGKVMNTARFHLLYPSSTHAHRPFNLDLTAFKNSLAFVLNAPFKIYKDDSYFKNIQEATPSRYY